MHYSILTALFAATNIPIASALTKGFFVTAAKDGASSECRNGDDWDKVFKDLKSLPQKITTVRFITSGACNVLDEAIPAAQRAGALIFAGVWATGDDNSFDTEVQALKSAILKYGSKWLTAVNVGDQDVYRTIQTNSGQGESASTIVKRIKQVRSMMTSVGATQPVGHSEPAATWAKTAAAHGGIIDASDFVGLSDIPFYDGLNVDDAVTAFLDRLSQAQTTAGNKPIWVTQTGWPVKGATVKNAVASITNAQTYWHNVACRVWNERGITLFWTVYQDYGASTSFGVFPKSGTANYDLKICPQPL
ncbi:hypothetical protein LTR27_003788 [Elasticomyces elasticus]|nr:hypothetical protein LTR27_003788 [Elasticomyces elasticus]